MPDLPGCSACLSLCTTVCSNDPRGSEWGMGKREFNRCQDTCGTDCKSSAVMKMCMWQCGWGCYFGMFSNNINIETQVFKKQNVAGGNAFCSTQCMTTCVGFCKGQATYVCGNYDCSALCEKTCRKACVYPAAAGGQSFVGQLDCGVKCNTLCNLNAGSSSSMMYCNGNCAGLCFHTCDIYVDSPTDTASSTSIVATCTTGVRLSSSNQQACVTKCAASCRNTCSAIGCTFTCGTAGRTDGETENGCRTLCAELVAINAGNGPNTCSGCTFDCSAGSMSSTPVSGDGCGSCDTDCTDSCSIGQSCSYQCMNGCKVSCDSGCEVVCIATCSDHCNLTCKTACSGCKDMCTACDQSCQDACIVTCFNQCAACRTNCTGQTTSLTECSKLCRADCNAMCISTCSGSCITWNSGGTYGGSVRSNATNNDWHGFTSNDAPVDGKYHYGPTTEGYPATSPSWKTTINDYPTKTNVPYGYGIAYNGTPRPNSNIGSTNGARGDWDTSSKGAQVGEQEWYHSDELDRGQWDEILDYDDKHDI